MFGGAFYGDEGSMLLVDNGYQIYDRNDKPVEKKSAPAGDHAANLLESIRNGTPPNAEIEIGYKSTLLCLLGTIAHRTGHTLHCDPKTGRPTDDPQADALWTRQYEPGWEPRV